MGYKVVWSPEAIEDVGLIAEYISRDSMFYAQSVVMKILEITQNIKDFPLTDRVAPELGNDKVRERFVYSYRLIYRIENQTMLVIAVVHGKRVFREDLGNSHKRTTSRSSIQRKRRR
jgi:plasmid stabilization system protein ParE